MKLPNLADLQRLKAEADEAAKNARRETLAAYHLLLHLISMQGFEQHVLYLEKSPEYKSDFELLISRVAELSEEFEREWN